jgi:hypothetical protein
MWVASETISPNKSLQMNVVNFKHANVLFRSTSELFNCALLTFKHTINFSNVAILFLLERAQHLTNTPELLHLLRVAEIKSEFLKGNPILISRRYWNVNEDIEVRNLWDRETEREKWIQDWTDESWSTRRVTAEMQPYDLTILFMYQSSINVKAQLWDL